MEQLKKTMISAIKKTLSARIVEYHKCKDLLRQIQFELLIAILKPYIIFRAVLDEDSFVREIRFFSKACQSVQMEMERVLRENFVYYAELIMFIKY